MSEPIALFGTSHSAMPRAELRYGALLGALLRAGRRCPDNTGSTGAYPPFWGVTVQNLGPASTIPPAGAGPVKGRGAG